VVLPPHGTTPSKAESGLASEVLDARLRALGFGTFTTAGGYGLEFFLPIDGPSDAATLAVLEATGDVAFVPLPAADYGERGLTAEVGKPLPKDEPALFGWDGIASAAVDDTQSAPAITVSLKPAAKEAFADYTASHVGEQFVILVDGVVAAAPTISDAIPGGEVTISGGRGDEEAFGAAVAILVGGMLPESWRDAQVPVILQKDAAIQAALGQYRAEGNRADGVQSAEIEVIPEFGGWQAVWKVVLLGEFRGECLLPGGAPRACASGTSVLAVLDATTGSVISSEVPAP
jgi:hypothetical protein